MRSSVRLSLALLALAGCAIEHGNPPPEQSAAAARSPHGAPDSAAGPLHGVFDRRVDTLAPGVTKVLVRVVLRPAGGREAARAAMEEVAGDARRDTAVSAVRVLGYVPPTRGHDAPGSPELIPYAYLDWVPAEGWDGVSAATARGAHHTVVVFVEDLAAHPGAQGSRRRGGRE